MCVPLFHKPDEYLGNGSQRRAERLAVRVGINSFQFSTPCQDDLRLQVAHRYNALRLIQPIHQSANDGALTCPIGAQNHYLQFEAFFRPQFFSDRSTTPVKSAAVHSPVICIRHPSFIHLIM